MAILDDVKVLLGIEDDLQDKLLKVIQKLTENHFKAYADVDEVPEECEFIIVEVMVKRFNRVGAEGVTSQKIGEVTASYTFDDFKPYDHIINGLNRAVRKVRFL